MRACMRARVCVRACIQANIWIDFDPLVLAKKGTELTRGLNVYLSLPSAVEQTKNKQIPNPSFTADSLAFGGRRLNVVCGLMMPYQATSGVSKMMENGWQNCSSI